MANKTSQVRAQPAEIIREYGPFADAEKINGVTFDGELCWAAVGTHLQAFDPETGSAVRRLPCAADAGTAFDGKHFFQLTADRIHKIDAKSGEIVGDIPAPGKGGDSGMAWAEGSLWVGHYRERRIHQVDPETGKVLRSIESDSFVTGVSWVEGELWHATWEGDDSELRRIDASTGELLERLEMPTGVGVSGLESDGRDTFFCGGGTSGKVRAVRRPKR